MSESRRERKQRRKRMAREAMEERRREESEARGGRNCYCRPGDDYCSTCRVCGRPGHLRHFPGPVPYTGSWCDLHYLRLKILHPHGSIGCWLYLAAAVVGANLLVRLLTG